jgi:hypothetical protein
MKLKLSQWKIMKRIRARVGRKEQIHNLKKKYDRKRNNKKIDPERYIEGTVNDY